MPSHRSAEGVAYREYCLAMQARLRLGREARPTLREAGLVTLELARLSLEIERHRLKPNAQKLVMRLEVVSFNYAQAEEQAQ